MKAVTGVFVLVGLLLGSGSASQLASAERSRAMLDGCVQSGPGVAIFKHIKVDRRHTIHAAVLGAGRAGVVLSNQSNASLCAWLPFAQQLRQAGYTVLLYDYGYGTYRAEIRAAITTLRRRGTQRVVLLGASQGAKVAILAAGRMRRTRAAGVLSLSAERDLDGVDIKNYAARVVRPVIFFSSENDGFGAAGAARLFYRVCPSTAKKLVMLPGDLHGIDLLSGPDGAAVKQQILAFLSAATAESS